MEFRTSSNWRLCSKDETGSEVVSVLKLTDVGLLDLLDMGLNGGATELPVSSSVFISCSSSGKEKFTGIVFCSTLIENCR